MAKQKQNLEDGAFGSLSDVIYRDVLTKIMDDTFPVRSRLPTEAELCKDYAASRPVVRQALLRLREDGLIQTRQGSGSVVLRRPGTEIQEFAPLNSIADIQRCFEFRIALEGEIAGLAAQRRDDTDLARIKAALDKLDEVLETGAFGVDEDFEFHLAIARAVGNVFFTSALQSLKPQTQFGMNLTRQLSLTSNRERLALIKAEHARIFAAIREQDPAAARDAMREHIANARLRMFEGT